MHHVTRYFGCNNRKSGGDITSLSRKKVQPSPKTSPRDLANLAVDPNAGEKVNFRSVSDVTNSSVPGSGMISVGRQHSAGPILKKVVSGFGGVQLSNAQQESVNQSLIQQEQFTKNFIGEFDKDDSMSQTISTLIIRGEKNQEEIINNISRCIIYKDFSQKKIRKTYEKVAAAHKVYTPALEKYQKLLAACPQDPYLHTETGESIALRILQGQEKDDTLNEVMRLFNKSGSGSMLVKSQAEEIYDSIVLTCENLLGEYFDSKCAGATREAEIEIEQPVKEEGEKKYTEESEIEIVSDDQQTADTLQISGETEQQDSTNIEKYDDNASCLIM